MDDDLENNKTQLLQKLLLQDDDSNDADYGIKAVGHFMSFNN